MYIYHRLFTTVAEGDFTATTKAGRQFQEDSSLQCSRLRVEEASRFGSFSSPPTFSAAADSRCDISFPVGPIPAASSASCFLGEERISFVDTAFEMSTLADSPSLPSTDRDRTVGPTSRDMKRRIRDSSISPLTVTPTKFRDVEETPVAVCLLAASPDAGEPTQANARGDPNVAGEIVANPSLDADMQCCSPAGPRLDAATSIPDICSQSSETPASDGVVNKPIADASISSSALDLSKFENSFMNRTLTTFTSQLKNEYSL